MRRVSAFTLVEILIVMCLLVLLTAMAWPALQRQLVTAELPESAERVRAALYMARSEAVYEHRRVKVSFPTDGQSPKVEVEANPLVAPGEYVAIRSAWAGEPILLGDVYVNEIRPGRPAFLTPLSKDDVEALGSKRSQMPAGGRLRKAQDVLPPLYFEVDGTTDWATLILARVKPGEMLDEKTEQAWVVLDGRTGLARVEGLVTEEQLANPELYVLKDKLEIPETTDVDDLNLQIDMPGTDGSADGGPSSLDGLAGAMGGTPADQQAAADQAGQQPTAQAPAAQTQGQEGQAETAGTLEELEKKLAESDLSDEEKDKIR